MAAKKERIDWQSKIDQIKQMAADGVSLSDAARKIGGQYGYLRTIAKRSGIKFQSAKSKICRVKGGRDKIVAQYRAGVPVPIIAAARHVHTASIYYHLRKAGVTSPGQFRYSAAEDRVIIAAIKLAAKQIGRSASEVASHVNTLDTRGAFPTHGPATRRAQRKGKPR